MYNQYFGLKEDPFSIAANPRFLYMSWQHREALAHLLYGIRSDSGFVLLSGDVGTGKTTVCRCLLQQLPEDTEVAYILNPKVSVEEMLGSICDELGIEHPPRGTVKTLVDAINRHLLEGHARGRKTVVIIDEAQNLGLDVLEQLRLLTNLETNERKLLRIVLLGQPELESMLARPELRQLQQRITARFHLHPLHRGEIAAYVQHRLAVAGCDRPLFSVRGLNKLYRKTRGVPRLINTICDRALLGAFVSSRQKVNGAILNKAAQEILGSQNRSRWLLPGSMAASLLLIGAATAAALFYQPHTEPAGPVTSGTAISTVASPPAEKPATVGLAMIEAPEPPTWPENFEVRDNTLSRALASQFAAWGLQLEEGIEDPCRAIVEHGYRCYGGSGNLGSVKANDRPAVLSLLAPNGEKYFVTLTGLQDQQATLNFAHGVETVSIGELESRWLGDYQLLWQVSPQGYSIFRPGDRGEGIHWLTRALLDMGQPLTEKNVYDDEVVQAVRGFQRTQGLIADGIAGRQTLMRLNSGSNAAIPRLVTREES